MRSSTIKATMLAAGAAAVALALSLSAPKSEDGAGAPHRVPAGATNPREADGVPARRVAAAPAADRIASLERRLAAETADRQRLQERLDELAAEVANLRGAAAAGESAPAAATTDAGREAPAAAASDAAASADAAAERAGEVDYGKSQMQRALEQAGLDEATAEGIKLRGDQLAMTEMYLRDQATREGWIDTPRFREEMDAIEAQRTSIREEIGDDAYDRYLFALGQTNRVIVSDVMFDSVAEDAGLKEGDLIIRYGDKRIFAPDELVASTYEGPAGDTVRLEIYRNGEPMALDVPRGPLGLRISRTQDDPDRS